MTPDPVESFRSLAEEYCALVEDVEAAAGDDLLERLRRLLPALLVAVEDLPHVEPSTDDLGPDVDHKAWSERYGALGAALGSRGGYWSTTDVVGPDAPEVLSSDLADDLADIWSDLKGPLLHLDGGGDQRDAIWDWRFHASIHWGMHAVEALRAVHSLTRPPLDAGPTSAQVADEE